MSETVPTVYLDEIDVTDLCQDGSVTPSFNRVGTASVRIQMEELVDRFGTMLPGAESMLKVYFHGGVLGTTPVLYHHGRVLLCETTADEQNGYAVFNSSDPLELWQWRPVRQPTLDSDGQPGNFVDPTVVKDYAFGPQIIEAILDGSEGSTAAAPALGIPPADAEGPLFLERGSFAVGGADLSGAPVDYPMTMAELATLLISTGELDIVITPIELNARGEYGRIDCYNGNYGLDLHSSVILQYGMGARNISALSWNEDMTQECNKLWYFLGPRKDTRHWRANVQGDDPFLAYPPGGTLQPPAAFLPAYNPLGIKRYASQQRVGVRMEIRIYDANNEAVVGREFYRRLWQEESWLRSVPINIVHITPSRDVQVGEFDIGDLVLVEATTDVRGGFSGVQRVYQYTASWTAAESVVSISDLQTSAGNEGF